MKVAFVKILEINGLPSPNCSQVFVKLLPSNQGSYGAVSGRQTLHCDGIWNFVYESRSQNFVAFSFFVPGPNKQELARLTIPFSWLPENTVVIAKCPCRCLISGAPTVPTAKIQIHLSENGAPGFQAPSGQLLVRLAVRPPTPQPPTAQQPYPYYPHPQMPYPWHGPPQYGFPGQPQYAVPPTPLPGRPTPSQYGFPGQPQYAVPPSPLPGRPTPSQYGFPGQPQYVVPPGPLPGRSTPPQYGYPGFAGQPQFVVPPGPQYGFPGQPQFVVPPGQLPGRTNPTAAAQPKAPPAEKAKSKPKPTPQTSTTPANSGRTKKVGGLQYQDLDTCDVPSVISPEEAARDPIQPGPLRSLEVHTTMETKPMDQSLQEPLWPSYPDI